MWILRRRNPDKVSAGSGCCRPCRQRRWRLGHGLQDAQKTMGVIFLALITTGHAIPATTSPCGWCVSAAGAISRRHVRRRVADHADARPHGSSTSTRHAGSPPRPWGRACSTRLAYVFEAPISTTQTITSAIMGAGATEPTVGGAMSVARPSWSPGC